MLTQDVVVKLILQHIGGAKLKPSPLMDIEGLPSMVRTAPMASLVTSLSQYGSTGQEIRDNLLKNPRAESANKILSAIPQFEAAVNSSTLTSPQKSIVQAAVDEFESTVQDFLRHTNILSGKEIGDPLAEQSQEFMDELIAIANGIGSGAAANAWAAANAAWANAQAAFANAQSALDYALLATGAANLAGDYAVAAENWAYSANSSASAANGFSFLAAGHASSANTSAFQANLAAVSANSSAASANSSAVLSANYAGQANSAAIVAQQYAADANSSAANAYASTIITAGHVASANGSAIAAAANAVAAEGFAVSANNSAANAASQVTLAANFATAANNSATAAAANAISAESSAVSANTSAASANASSVLAAGYASAANGSAGAAAANAVSAQGSATAANSSAANASASSTLAATYSTNALGSLRQTHPTDIQTDYWDYYWAPVGGSFVGFESPSDFPTITVGTMFNGGGGSSATFLPKWAYPATPGKTYKVYIEARNNDALNTILAVVYEASSADAPGAGLGITLLTAVGVAIPSPANIFKMLEFEYTVPASPSSPFIKFGWYGNPTGGALVQVKSFSVGDGTSEKASQTFASIANNAAVSANSSAASANASSILAAGYAGSANTSATAAAVSATSANSSAASAQTNALLSASVGKGYLNPNANFASWADPWLPPTGWSVWGGGGFGGGVNTRYDMTALGYNSNQRPEMSDWGYGGNPPTAGTDAGIQSNYDTPIPIGVSSFIVEATARLYSSSWYGAGVLIYFFNAGGGYIGAEYLRFAYDPDVTGAVGSTSLSLRKWSKKVTAVPGTYFVRLYCMANWSGFPDGVVDGKSIAFFNCGIKGMDAVGAQVETHSSAIATLDSRTASYLLKVSAGSGTATLALQATDSGGSPATSITALADVLRLGNATSSVPTLQISNGVAQFTGELNVGTGSGARVNITKDLIRVYDANNVMRVRMGVW